MNTKLTLSIDERTIRKAKKFAKERHRSLSNLVEGYLNAVTIEEPATGGITPLVAELSGVVPATSVQGRRDAYADYLKEKYR